MESDTQSIRISETAAREVKRLMEREKLPITAGIRVGVRGGGCSGFTYVMDFEQEPHSGDHVIESDGVRIFCDEKSLPYLTGTELDFSEGLMGRGFQFKNPNASGTCGCGESFSV